MTDTARLQELEDREQIRQIFVDYATYLDSGDHAGQQILHHNHDHRDQKDGGFNAILFPKMHEAFEVNQSEAGEDENTRQRGSGNHSEYGC